MVGANSITYPPIFDGRWFFELVRGTGKMTNPFDLDADSQLIGVSGFNATKTDLRGNAVIGSYRELGALEYDPDLLFRRVYTRQL